MPTPIIRVAIAENQTAFREAMIFTISHFNGYCIDIEATNGSELIDKIGVAEILPDICIMDVNMPIMDAYTALPVLKKRWPQVKVLILSMHNNDYAIKSMLLQGASGYLSKDASLNEIYKALNSVYELGYYHSENAPSDLFDKVTKGKINIPEISGREKDVLRLLCKNYTYKEIAEELYISVRTVDSHRDHLFSKLNIKSKEGLILFALQTGIVSI